MSIADTRLRSRARAVFAEASVLGEVGRTDVLLVLSSGHAEPARAIKVFRFPATKEQLKSAPEWKWQKVSQN